MKILVFILLGWAAYDHYERILDGWAGRADFMAGVRTVLLLATIASLCWLLQGGVL